MNKDLDDYDVSNHSYVGYNYIQLLDADEDKEEKDDNSSKHGKKKKNK